MNAGMIELVVIPILVLLPLTLVDAGMGILFVVLAIRSIDHDSLFRGMTFLFGTLLLASSLYVSTLSVTSLINRLMPLFS